MSDHPLGEHDRSAYVDISAYLPPYNLNCKETFSRFPYYCCLQKIVFFTLYIFLVIAWISTKYMWQRPKMYKFEYFRQCTYCYHPKLDAWGAEGVGETQHRGGHEGGQLHNRGRQIPLQVSTYAYRTLSYKCYDSDKF